MDGTVFRVESVRNARLELTVIWGSKPAAPPTNIRERGVMMKMIAYAWRVITGLPVQQGAWCVRPGLGALEETWHVTIVLITQCLQQAVAIIRIVYVIPATGEHMADLAKRAPQMITARVVWTNMTVPQTQALLGRARMS